MMMMEKCAYFVSDTLKHTGCHGKRFLDASILISGAVIASPRESPRWYLYKKKPRD